MRKEMFDWCVGSKVAAQVTVRPLHCNDIICAATKSYARNTINMDTMYFIGLSASIPSG